MSLSQSLQQKLTQKLSPQQIQLMKLLQVPTANLEERIKDELENNPALDTGAETANDPYGLNEFEPGEKDNYEGKDNEQQEGNSDSELDNFDVSEYLRDEGDMQSDYHLYENRDDDDEPMSNPVRVETTFTEYLANQMGMLDLDERRTDIAEQIIGSIDDDGYLRRDAISIADDLAFNRNIETDEREVKSLIKMIQGFDPPGVAAQDLRECLLLQLKRLDIKNPVVNIAVKILFSCFDEI